MRHLGKLLRDRKAATAVEYGLIAALIVVASIGAFTLVANSTIGMWSDVASNTQGAM